MKILVVFTGGTIGCVRKGEVLVKCNMVTTCARTWYTNSQS